jgi:hypothetical protein
MNLTSIKIRFCLFPSVTLKAALFPAFLLALTSVMASPANILSDPEIPAEQALETLWTQVRTKEFQGTLSIEPNEGMKGGPCLRVTALDVASSEPYRYGEWRFKQQPQLEEGAEYRFAMWTKGQVDAPVGAGAYVNIYGFDESDKPRALFTRQVDVSEKEWTEFQGTFVVPKGIRRVRLGVGISQGSGWATFDRLWLAPSEETPTN